MFKNIFLILFICSQALAVSKKVINSDVKITGGTVSTSSATGALVLSGSGGLGVGGAINNAGNISTTNSATDNTFAITGNTGAHTVVTTTGEYKWSAGRFVGANRYTITPSTAINGNTFSNPIFDSTASTGAISIGNATLGGAVTFPVTTSSSSPSTGAVILSGGLGVAGAVFTTGSINTATSLFAQTAGSVVVGTQTTPLVIKSIFANSNGLRVYSNTATDVASVVNGYNANLELGANSIVYQTISGAGLITLGASGGGQVLTIHGATEAAAAGAATLLNMPTNATGNPDVFLRISYNGTTYVIPAWTP